MAGKPRSAPVVRTSHLPPACTPLPHDAAEALRRAVAHRFGPSGGWIDNAQAVRDNVAPLAAVIAQVKADHPEHFQ